PLHPDEARLQADPTLRPGAYAVGEALFSAADPARLLERTAQPVLQPVWPYERNGRRAAGGVFAEGLVSRQGQWLLYYGAADSVIGVARAPLH
ncbi:MAG: pesticidal protein Cry15Aa, partial [Acidobacteriota bacterium]